MGVIINQGFKTSLGFYMGIILGIINTLFISTYFLSPSEFGISRLLIENSIVFAAFIHLGAPHILDRFFYKLKDSHVESSKILFLLLLLPHIGFVFLLIIYYIFRISIEGYFLEQSNDFIPYIWVCIPMSYLWAIFLIFESYLRSQKNVFYATFMRETIFRILNIVTILLYGYGVIDFQTFIYLQIISLFLIVIFVIIKVINSCDFKFSIGKVGIDRDQLIEILKFGAIVIFGGLGANLIIFIDRNIIANKMGTTSAAIFMIAVYISSTIEIPLKSIKQISVPFFSEYFSKNDFSSIGELYKKAAINFFLISCIMFVLIFVNLSDLLSILPKQETYKNAAGIVLIIISGKCIEMSLGLNNEIIALSKYYKFNTYLILIMMVFIIFLNNKLIPIYGIYGAAYATFIITIISSASRLIYAKHKFNMNLFSKSHIFIILLFVLIMGIGYLMNLISFKPFFLKVLYIIIKSLFLITIYLFFCIRFKVSNDLNIIFNKLMSKFKISIN